MAIPEHSKCVKCKKGLRHDSHYGNWKRVRAVRRREGYLTPRFRIRTILMAERKLHNSNLLKKYGYSTMTEFNKSILGPYYKKYGKYD